MVTFDTFASTVTQLGSRKAQATPWSIYDDNENGIPIISDEKRKARQEAEKAAQYREARAKDVDDFLLEYVRYRAANRSVGVVVNAKILDNNKEEYILSEAGSAEVKRLAEELDVTEKSLSTLNLHARGGARFTEEQIRHIVEKYDVLALTREQKTALLAELTAMNALSYGEFTALVEETGGGTLNLSQYVRESIDRHAAEYAARVRRGGALEERDLARMEFLSRRMQSLGALGALAQAAAPPQGRETTTADTGRDAHAD